MQKLHRRFTLAVLIGLCLTGLAIADKDKDKDKDDKDKDKKGAYVETDLVVNQKVGTVPTLTDANGIVHIAKFFDPNLVNPWGISESQGSPFWVSDNGAGVSTLYNTQGMPQSLVVSIPTARNPLGTDGSPTGTVFNIAMAANAFKISGFDASNMPTSKPAIFLFATEDGTIVGWNPTVNPAGFDPAKAGTYGIIAATTPGAVYKGLAIATDATGVTRLYATNFRAGTVDVFDTSFTLVNSPDAFEDRKLPDRYSPFNIQVIGAKLFVTYAVRDAAGKDDVKGEGHGIINIFNLDGGSGERFAQHGQLNSPWGLALTPDNFGDLGGTLWVGNFGNGHIDAYDFKSGEFAGKVRNSDGQALVIDGLWALKFGNGASGGNLNTLYFTAGPNDEKDGLFGSILPGDNGKK
jgi:uncharacterized protein (TIGR03118 family)